VGRVVTALLYLRITSLRNALLSRFRRLKQPKYLVGAVVGVAYLYFFFLRRLRPSQGPATAGLRDTFPVDGLPVVAAVAALLLTIFVALYWLWPRARAALAFSEAEIAFLFPAPLSRRSLIHYRLINAQARLLFTASILTFVSSGWGFVPGNAGIRVLGWWLVLSTMDLHAVGSSFVITRLLDRGVTSLRRQLAALCIAAVVVAGASVWTWRGLRAPVAADVANVTALADYLAILLSTGPLSWLLLPAKWVVQPLLAGDLRSLLLALGPALLVYAAHYLWVLRTEVSFEEASIARAEKRAARRNATTPEDRWRIGTGSRKARRAPFKLASVRRPELAFLWKNLLSSAEYLRPRTALVALAVIVVGCNWLARTDLEVFRGIVATLSIVGAGFAVFFGPMMAYQDLRRDLPNADILKTYPLRGWQVVLGEVLTPIAIITVLVWLMLLAASLTFLPERIGWLTAGVRAAALIGLGLMAPLLCAIQVLVMNASVVLFPAWIQTGPGRASGIDVLGQRILFVAGLFFVMTVSLLPAAIGAAAVFLASAWFAGVPVATALAAAAVIAVLTVEIAMGIWWLGARFESFDLSAELRP
jgi:ABC-2 type transport system permease protein